jgi:hypothetical protein
MEQGPTLNTNKSYAGPQHVFTSVQNSDTLCHQSVQLYTDLFQQAVFDSRPASKLDTFFFLLSVTVFIQF